MAMTTLTDQLLQEATTAYSIHGKSGWKYLNIPRNTYVHRCKVAEDQGLLNRAIVSQTLESRGVIVDQPPQADLTIEEILATKKEVAKRRIAASDFANLINVKVNIEGPIGLVVAGDPHLDDDACDIERFEQDLNVACKNEGMFMGHVGDITNNWVGRLAVKYADQISTRAHAKKLIEWALKDRPNLFVISGNHDLWNNGQDLLDWALQGQSVAARPHGVRLKLNFPQGDSIRIHARHDFPGNSIYNPSHSLRRELAFGLRDHILLAGHRHTDAYSMHAHAEDPWISHLFRVSGYKMVDDYAEANRFMPHRFAPSVTLIINPTANPVEKVKPFWDAETGADYLKFLRRRRK